MIPLVEGGGHKLKPSFGLACYSQLRLWLSSLSSFFFFSGLKICTISQWIKTLVRARPKPAYKAYVDITMYKKCYCLILACISGRRFFFYFFWPGKILDIIGQILHTVSSVLSELGLFTLDSLNVPYFRLISFKHCLFITHVITITYMDYTMIFFF